MERRGWIYSRITSFLSVVNYVSINSNIFIVTSSICQLNISDVLIIGIKLSAYMELSVYRASPKA